VEALDDLQRSLFDALYTYRIPILIGSIVAAIVVLVIAWQRGWFESARRHPARAVALGVVVLAIGLPLAYYTASPLFIRTELIEDSPIAAASVPTAAPAAATPTTTSSADPTPSAAAPTSAPIVEPVVFSPRIISTGSFQGTDDFHFGSGTATLIETAPGEYRLRLEDFSVRNGPDLFVYLSPKANDYARGALELGRLKATDGSFNYTLPQGGDPAHFESAIIWCKQFSHLFAFAPLVGVE
jgi:Electron transfer DM13